MLKQIKPTYLPTYILLVRLFIAAFLQYLDEKVGLRETDTFSQNSGQIKLITF